MPSVLLSACGNGAAEFVNGAKENEVMRAVLDLTRDYLHVSGLGASVIAPAQARPGFMPFGVMATAARRQKSALVLLVCSGNYKGERRGIELCFPIHNDPSRRFAGTLAEYFKPVAPGPVQQVPQPMPEFRMTKCPVAQVRLGCRGHQEDAQWMLQGTGVIAHTLARAATTWFDVPLKSPFAHCEAAVVGGSLALRRAPGTEAKQLRTLPKGAKLLLLHRDGDWQYVEHEGACGYVLRKYLSAE